MKASDQLALIALGSNLGDSRQTIRRAFEELEQLSTEPTVRSSLWESSPVDCPPGSPPFVNAAAAIVLKAGETPEGLLQKLRDLERKFGRKVKTVLNEARPLDLDLIAFGKETRNSAILTLPHPRAHLRQFVLRPLGEVAPDFVLPGCDKSITQLLEDLRTDEQLRRLEEQPG